MRECNNQVTSTEIKSVNTVAVKEAIISVCEYRQAGFIGVTVAKYGINNDNVANENYVIKGDNYEILMSANPSFAPQKPADEYRDDDLWYIIDKIRNGVN